MSAQLHSRSLGEVPGIEGSNALGMDPEMSRPLIEALSADVASMFILYHQYHKHHWCIAGPQFLELHQLLEEHYTELHAHFDMLAERVVTLGGMPPASPEEVTAQSYIEHEPSGLPGPRDMLSCDRDAERRLAIMLREHIRLTRELGDYGSEDLLKELLDACEKRASFLEKHLIKQSLSRTALK